VTAVRESSIPLVTPAAELQQAHLAEGDRIRICLERECPLLNVAICQMACAETPPSS